MKGVKKTALVFFYLQLVLLPFAYLIGVALFGSSDWPFNEWEIVGKDGKIITGCGLLVLESIYLYLSIKY